MSVKLSDFATGVNLADTDYVVGYNNTNTGGERKWTVSNLRNSLITGAATTIDTENLATNKAVVSDSSGKIAASNVTSTEVGYLAGTTSSIQNQLNGRVRMGTGTLQTNNIVNIGWSAGSVLRVQVDSTDFGANWPINITGTSNASNFALTPQFAGDSVSKDDITTRTETGFYQTNTGTTGEGWPITNNTWQHLIACTHSNDANYYSMQIGGSFYDQEFYGRKTNGNGSQGWVTFVTSANSTSFNANNANYATTAGTANNANYATTAGTANNGIKASGAISWSGNNTTGNPTANLQWSKLNNVSSITWIEQGIYKITFSTAMPDNRYSVVAMINLDIDITSPTYAGNNWYDGEGAGARYSMKGNEAVALATNKTTTHCYIVIHSPDGNTIENTNGFAFMII